METKVSPLGLRNSNQDSKISQLNPKITSLDLFEDKENIFPLKRPKESTKPKKKINLSQMFPSWLESEDIYCSPCKLTRSSPLITDSMRSKLMKWLIEVCDIFKLDREVFFLSVDILDRFLALECSSDVKSDQLQLIGISALFVAAKFESVEFCSVEEYAEMTANTFSSMDVVRMEIKILVSLDWKISNPTPILWLKLFLQSYFTNDVDFPDFSEYKLVQGSKMLVHVLLDGGCCKFRRSVLTCAVFNVLMRTINPKYEMDYQYVLYEHSELVRSIAFVMGIVKPLFPSLSAMGSEIFVAKESNDRHNVVRWDASLASKSKRQCSVE